MNKKASPPKQQGSQNNAQQAHSNSLPEQRKRLLVALRIAPVTTISARHELDILHPAGRVQELREQGHNIVTYRDNQETPEGNKHRVARYVLLAGIYQGGSAND